MVGKTRAVQYIARSLFDLRRSICMDMWNLSIRYTKTNHSTHLCLKLSHDGRVVVHTLGLENLDVPVKYQIPNIEYQISNIIFQISNIIPDIIYHTRDHQRPATKTTPATTTALMEVLAV